MNPIYALHYAELVGDTLSDMDATDATYFKQNTELYRTRSRRSTRRSRRRSRRSREEPQAADLPRLVRVLCARYGFA